MRRQRRRLAASIGLATVFVIGAILLVGVVLVHGRLLDAGTYTSALAENDAYERTYTEVLADPELAVLTEQLLGRLRVGAVSPTQLRALTTSALRWTVPPSTLRGATETTITAVVRYLRGDVDRLEIDVDVTAVLARIDDTAVREARTLLAYAADQAAGSVDDFRAQLDALAEELATGTVPDGVPILGGAAFDPAQIVDAILDELVPDADEGFRRQITAAVLADDQRDAVITASTQFVSDHATDVSERLGASADQGRELDIVAEIADRARRPAGQVVGALNSVRDAVRWFSPAAGVVGAVLMLAAAVALGWLHRDDPRRAAYALGSAALAAGGAIVFLWLLIMALAGSPLGPATTTGAGSWNLPAGVRSLIGDIGATLGQTLAETVWRWAGFFLLAGAIIVAGTALAGAAASRRLAVTPRRLLATAGVLVILVAVAGFVTLDRDPQPHACNGHLALCERPYDEVVYAATHNSMSSPDVVAVWPEHDGDLRAQLDAGVRALLIDTHYWSPLVSAEQISVLDPFVSPELARVLYDGLGPLREPRDGTFLCHATCAFGAIELVEALVDVKSFLDDNPNEVVTLIIQDAITPDDTESAMRAAGLDPFLHAHQDGEPWATLGDLVASGERLVVFAEEEGAPPPWYLNAFEYIQETPFLFLSPDQFSCVPNRGDPDATLFLLNHWVQRVAPDRVDAVDVNRFDVLVDRALDCERERGLRPNFIAVNFYNIGDLMPAVDTLNGVS